MLAITPALVALALGGRPGDQQPTAACVNTVHVSFVVTGTGTDDQNSLPPSARKPEDGMRNPHAGGSAAGGHAAPAGTAAPRELR